MDAVKPWMEPRIAGGKVDSHQLHQQAKTQNFESVRKVGPGLDKSIGAAAE